VAMLWVGGGIVLHGLEELGFGSLTHLAHGAQLWVEHASGPLGAATGWVTYAGLSALLGLLLGALIAFVLHNVLHFGENKAA
jgi:uncharacterized protein